MKVVEIDVTVNLYRWGIHNIAILSCSLQSLQMHVAVVPHCAMRPRASCLHKQKYLNNEDTNDDVVHKQEWFDELPDLVPSDVDEHDDEDDAADFAGQDVPSDFECAAP